MTAAEIEHFLTCVEDNSPNEFGLVRLSELALDDFLDVERRGYAWDAVRDVGLEGPQTLLTYAAWLGRAWIVRALLRAGADPSARPENRYPSANMNPSGSLPPDRHHEQRQRHGTRRPPALGPGPGPARSPAQSPTETPRTLGDLTRLMLQQYPESATWLTMAMVRARALAKPRARDNRRDADFAAAACASCAARPPVAPVAFAPCRHVACEACAWRHVIDHHGEMGCPLCDVEAEVPHDPKLARRARDASLARWLRLPEDAKAAAVAHASDASNASKTVTKASETSDDIHADGVDDGVAMARSDAALGEGEMVGGRPVAAPDRWLGPGMVRVRGSRKTFVPEPPGRAARRRVAKLTTRRERDEALRTAAASGDVPTVRALVAAGADVDAADECGLGPLAVAAWRGRAATVRELLRAGADHAAVAPGGATPWSAARANGHEAVLRELRRVAAEELEGAQRRPGPPGATGAPDPAGGSPRRRRRESSRVTSRDPAPRTTRLPVPANVLADVPSGVGALYVDDGLPEPFLAAAEDLMAAVRAAAARSACSDASRSRFADVDGWVREGLARAIERGIDADGGIRTGDRPAPSARPRPRARVVVLPRMRFLRYPEPGGRLAPHVDLRKHDEETGGRSTHTFCLYLATCERGGETVLLDRVRDPTDPMSDRVGVTAFGGEGGGKGVCAPRRGRVLVFPHDCPHAGRPVVDVPKLLLRGECYFEWEEEEDEEDEMEMETVPRGEGGGGG